MFPLKAGKKVATLVGTNKQTIEGISRYEINLMVVTFFPIHNMVVVTSPIGDQAPPAFAAIMINPANQILVSLLGTTFCKIVIKTITHLPPYVGMMFSLALVSTFAEILSSTRINITSFDDQSDESASHSPVLMKRMSLVF